MYYNNYETSVTIFLVYYYINFKDNIYLSMYVG